MTAASPTKSALLTLRDEEKSFGEAQRFLEEKRAVLANALVQGLRAYQRDYQRFQQAYLAALQQLQQAVAFQGGKNLESQAAVVLEALKPTESRQNLLGVPLRHDHWPEGIPMPVYPIPVIQMTAEKFAALLPQAFALAQQRRNLQNLFREYQKTERRSRALEEVLLPELRESMRTIEEQLEALDLEDAIRVRR